MRIWDKSLLPHIDNVRVNAQHHEIHCIDSINQNHLQGFYNHPETKRWRGHRIALAYMHELTRDEMDKRGIVHTDKETADLHEFILSFSRAKLESCIIPENWQSAEDQIALLRSKGCKCKV